MDFVISTVPPSSLTTYNDCLREIRSCIAKLKELALVTDFSKEDQAKRYGEHVAYLKMFYARAERIARDGK